MSTGEMNLLVQNWGFVRAIFQMPDCSVQTNPSWVKCQLWQQNKKGQWRHSALSNTNSAERIPTNVPACAYTMAVHIPFGKIMFGYSPLPESHQGFYPSQCRRSHQSAPSVRCWLELHIHNLRILQLYHVLLQTGVCASFCQITEENE